MFNCETAKTSNHNRNHFAVCTFKIVFPIRQFS